MLLYLCIYTLNIVSHLVYVIRHGPWFTLYIGGMWHISYMVHGLHCTHRWHLAHIRQGPWFTLYILVATGIYHTWSMVYTVHIGGNWHISYMVHGLHCTHRWHLVHICHGPWFTLYTLVASGIHMTRSMVYTVHIGEI